MINYRTRLVLAVFCLSFFTLPLLAFDEPTVAVNDLEVNSDNPKYKYLGKGFSEIVSYELNKSSALSLVNRERRNELINEMKFSLSGMSSEADQLELGRLLTVHYMVFGEITDMGDILLINLQMVDVESSKVVWSDQVTEPGGKYSYIGATFAKSILEYFDEDAEDSTVEIIAAEVTVDTKAVVALSEGIDAMDKGEKEEAVLLFNEAKEIDPDNEIITYYLSRLASVSARFKVVPERYVSYYNPAYLGGMEQDILTVNTYATEIMYGLEDTHNNGIDALNPTEEYGTREHQGGGLLEYSFPFSETVGLGISYFMGGIFGGVVDTDPPGDTMMMLGNNESSSHRVMLVGGVEVNPRLSLGCGINGTITNRRYFIASFGDVYRKETSWSFGGVIAAVIKNRTGSVIWDVEAAYGTDKQHWYDTAADEFVEYGLPLYTEQTLTFALNQQKTFFAVKQMNDIYFDRELYYGRIMPVVEHWFTNFFSLRAGIEGTLINLDGTALAGYGGTAGVTVKLWGINLDLNYTFRMKPSRNLEETIVPEGVVFVTISKSGLFFK